MRGGNSSRLLYPSGQNHPRGALSIPPYDTYILYTYVPTDRNLIMLQSPARDDAFGPLDI